MSTPQVVKSFICGCWYNNTTGEWKPCGNGGHRAPEVLAPSFVPRITDLIEEDAK